MISALLNKRISIEKSTFATNSAGTSTLVWEQYLEAWASIYTPYRRTEYNDGEMFIYTTEFTIRYNDITIPINNKYRIKYKDNYYKIEQISEIGIKEGFKIITTAFDNG
jgi:head-tail adaptor